MEDILEGIYQKFLVDLKKNFKCYQIKYSGTGVSLNQFYAQGHWSARSNLKNKYKPIFQKALKETIGDDSMDKFVIILEYNSRHDTDNIVGLEKIFTDAFKKDKDGNGWATEDSNKNFLFFGIKPVKKLPHDQFVFNVIKIA